MPRNLDEAIESQKKVLEKAKKPAIFSLEGIVSLGTAAAGIFASIGLPGTAAKVTGLVVAGGVAIFLAHKRGSLKEMLIQLAAELSKPE
jgi:hypothetical protein